MNRAVTVIGDALLDVHVTPAMPMRPGGDVPAAIRLTAGGQGANLAVRLARRAIDVRLVCATGDDPAGTLVRGALRAEDVEIVDLDADETGAVVVLLDEERDRTMLSRRVPLLGRLAGDPRRDSLLAAAWVVVSGYALLEPAAGLPVTAATARLAVVGCSLEAAQAPVWERALASLNAHLVVLSLEEAVTVMAGAGDPSAVARAFAARIDAVVAVTHARGAAAATADGVVEARARHEGPIVDTTGAGDAFAAGLIAELLDEEEWPPGTGRMSSSMRAATDLAGAVTRVVGAQARVAGERGGRLQA